jgi:hypothetical protein
MKKTKTYMANMKNRYHREDVSIDEEIILKLILKK